MSLPSAAAAPVSGARRPILTGPPCAGAVRGAASDAASATLRTAASVRTWMRVIGGGPLPPPPPGPRGPQPHPPPPPPRRPPPPPPPPTPPPPPPPPPPGRAPPRPPGAPP